MVFTVVEQLEVTRVFAEEKQQLKKAHSGDKATPEQPMASHL